MGVPEPISIRAPLTGCDLRSAHQDSGTSYFNPRTPYGVRRRLPQPSVSIVFISIHAPLAGCDDHDSRERTGRNISIHAPLTGCDLVKSISRFARNTFQSTHPLRGATARLGHGKEQQMNFNPRTPCGVRRNRSTANEATTKFQSTHPSRGATGRSLPALRSWRYFNPRTPCGVRRQFPNGTLPTAASFQSTHPLRGATAPHPADH